LIFFWCSFFSVFFFLFGGIFFFHLYKQAFYRVLSMMCLARHFFCFAFSVCGYDKLWFGILLCSVIT
jgi:hypothetical protein